LVDLKKLFDAAGAAVREGIMPLSQAFSPCDCKQERPLVEALACGFTGIEADVWRVKDQIVVAHDMKDVHKKRTLEEMYLEPLRRLVEEGGGTLYPRMPQTVQLMIDVKTEAESTYRLLHETLEKYKDILTTFRDGEVEKQGAVTLVISGHRARETMEKQQVRYAAIDGRVPDLLHAVPPTLMPQVSDRWGEYFKWNGEGEMPEEERRNLRKIVGIAHDNGQRIRFWHTPDKTPEIRAAVWRELTAAGVDHVHSQHLAELRDWLQQNRPAPFAALIPWFEKPRQIRARTQEEAELLTSKLRTRICSLFERIARDTRFGPPALIRLHALATKARRPHKRLSA
jgi:hypothetical protein